MIRKIKIRRDTESNWNNANPILQDGEIAYDKTNHYLKIGDGSTDWKNLSPVNFVKGMAGNIGNPLLYLPLKNSLAMVHGTGSVIFQRSSTATYIDRYGVLKYAAVDEPRFEKEGLLIEGSSTNLLLYSEKFDESVWGTYYASVAQSTTELAPDGVNYVWELKDTTDSTGHILRQFVEEGTNKLSGCIFLKKANGSMVTPSLRFYKQDGTYLGAVLFRVDLNTMNVVNIVESNVGNSNYTIKALNNDWYLLRMSTEYIGSDTVGKIALYIFLGDGNSYAGDGTTQLYIWGAQLEELPFASSYIPTQDATVTRAGDWCKVTAKGNIPEFDQEITMAVDWDTYGNAGDIDKLILGGGNDYSRFFFGYGGGTDLRIYRNVSGSFRPYNDGNYHTGRLIYTNDTAAGKLFSNGSLLATSTYLDPSPPYYLSDYIGIGCAGWTNDKHLWGHIANIRIYDRALSDLECQLL